MLDPAPSRIELRHLRSYIAVAEERHFRRAAERLHMTQPPLSAQIKALEEALGVELLSRDRRGVEVTPAGRAFLEQARRVLACMDEAVDVARGAARGETGRLSIGFVGSAMYGRVPVLLRGFRTEHPGVHLTLRELSTGSQVEALSSGAIDVGFLRPPIAAEGVVIRSLLQEGVVIVLPDGHPLAAKPALRLSELQGSPLVLLSHLAAPALHDAVVLAFTQDGRAPDIVQEVDELQTAVGLVASGLGVSLVPASVRALDRHDVVYRDVEGPAPRIALAVAHRVDDPSPVLASFLAAIRDEATDE
jgi:DNA-binding transcriptional LysR family regulator